MTLARQPVRVSPRRPASERYRIASEQHEDSDSRSKNAHETRHDELYPTRFDLCGVVGAMHLPSGHLPGKRSRQNRKDQHEESYQSETQLKRHNVSRDHVGKRVTKSKTVVIYR